MTTKLIIITFFILASINKSSDKHLAPFSRAEIAQKLRSDIEETLSNPDGKIYTVWGSHSFNQRYTGIEKEARDILKGLLLGLILEKKSLQDDNAKEIIKILGKIFTVVGNTVTREDLELLVGKTRAEVWCQYLSPNFFPILYLTHSTFFRAESTPEALHQAGKNIKTFYEQFKKRYKTHPSVTNPDQHINERFLLALHSEQKEANDQVVPMIYLAERAQFARSEQVLSVNNPDRQPYFSFGFDDFTGEEDPFSSVTDQLTQLRNQGIFYSQIPAQATQNATSIDTNQFFALIEEFYRIHEKTFQLLTIEGKTVQQVHDISRNIDHMISISEQIINYFQITNLEQDIANNFRKVLQEIESTKNLFSSWSSQITQQLSARSPNEVLTEIFIAHHLTPINGLSAHNLINQVHQRFEDLIAISIRSGLLDQGQTSYTLRYGGLYPSAHGGVSPGFPGQLHVLNRNDPTGSISGIASIVHDEFLQHVISTVGFPTKRCFLLTQGPENWLSINFGRHSANVRFRIDHEKQKITLQLNFRDNDSSSRRLAILEKVFAKLGMAGERYENLFNYSHTADLNAFTMETMIQRYRAMIEILLTTARHLDAYLSSFEQGIEAQWEAFEKQGGVSSIVDSLVHTRSIDPRNLLTPPDAWKDRYEAWNHTSRGDTPWNSYYDKIFANPVLVHAHHLGQNIRPNLNAILLLLGLSPIPDDIPFGAPIISKYYTEPIREGLASGKLMRDEHNRVVINPNYRLLLGIDTILTLVNDDQTVIDNQPLTDAINKMNQINLFEADKLADVGTMEIHRLTFLLPGEKITAIALFDWRTGKYVFSLPYYGDAIHSADQKEPIKNSNIIWKRDTLEKILRHHNITLEPYQSSHKPSKKYISSIRETLTSEVPSTFLDMDYIPGTSLSGSNYSGLARIQFNTANLDSTCVFITPYADVETVQLVQSKGAKLITLEGHAASHPAVIAQEKNTPWVKISSRLANSVSMRKYKAMTVSGYAVKLYEHIPLVLHDEDFIYFDEGRILYLDEIQETLKLLDQFYNDPDTYYTQLLQAILNTKNPNALTILLQTMIDHYIETKDENQKLKISNIIEELLTNDKSVLFDTIVQKLYQKWIERYEMLLEHSLERISAITHVNELIAVWNNLKSSLDQIFQVSKVLQRPLAFDLSDQKINALIDKVLEKHETFQDETLQKFQKVYEDVIDNRAKLNDIFYIQKLLLRAKRLGIDLRDHPLFDWNTFHHNYRLLIERSHIQERILRKKTILELDELGPYLSFLNNKLRLYLAGLPAVKEIGAQIPNGFVFNSRAAMDSDAKIDWEKISEIINRKIPPQDRTALLEKAHEISQLLSIKSEELDRLKTRLAKLPFPIIIRPSSDLEDSEEFSGAGMLDSPTANNIEEAVLLAQLTMCYGHIERAKAYAQKPSTPKAEFVLPLLIQEKIPHQNRQFVVYFSSNPRGKRWDQALAVTSQNTEGSLVMSGRESGTQVQMHEIEKTSGFVHTLSANDPDDDLLGLTTATPSFDTRRLAELRESFRAFGQLFLSPVEMELSIANAFDKPPIIYQYRPIASLLNNHQVRTFSRYIAEITQPISQLMDELFDKYALPIPSDSHDIVKKIVISYYVRELLKNYLFGLIRSSDGQQEITELITRLSQLSKSTWSDIVSKILIESKQATALLPRHWEGLTSLDQAA